MLKKKIIILFLITMINLSSVGLVFGESVQYNTKKAASIDWINHWASNSIETAMIHGWISRSEKFRPDDSITRAESIKIIVEAYNFSEFQDISFLDVNKNDWYYKYVCIALANDVISKDVYFRPNDKITRQEFATIISNIETKKQGDSNHDKYKKYEDYNTSDLWSRNSIEYVIEKGYMGVGSNIFNPKSYITRGEVTTTVVRVINPVKAGIKMPKLSFASQNSIKIKSEYGEPIGGSYVDQYSDKIKGNLYVKYGDPKLGAHNYRINNQKSYDIVVDWTINSIKRINYRMQIDWVYLQYYFKGNKNDNFVDPILQFNGKNITYGQWRDKYSKLIESLENGYINAEDVEKIVLYRSTCNDLVDLDSEHWTEYDVSDDVYYAIYPSYGPNWHSYYTLVGDILGMNTMVIHDVSYGGGIVDVVQVGDYWWINGLEKSIKKTENPFKHYKVNAAPTYNLESLYLK